MAEGFEFKDIDNRLCLTLCGKKFDVEINDDTVLKCRKILEGAKKRLKQMKDGIQSDELSDAGVCGFLQQSMDSLLGDGAVSTVFGSRPVTLGDITQLTCYVISELRKAVSEFEM